VRDGLRIFDAHVHVGTARHSGRRYTADQLLADMDRHGIERSLAIPFPVVDDHRAAHDEIAAAVRAHPDRLAGAACLYPFIPESKFRDEVRRCAEELGFRALKLQPQYQPLNPISPRSDFFFEAAASHGLPVVCHTGTGAPFALPSLFIVPARRYPELPFVLAHSGGSVYVLEAIVAALTGPNVYLELSTLAPHHVLEVLAHVGPERLMIGSDLPESVETEIGKILSLGLDPEVTHAILWDTPARVFGD
jgi:predicted TIM-barrel fold metal-dependent hydrolase